MLSLRIGHEIVAKLSIFDSMTELEYFELILSGSILLHLYLVKSICHVLLIMLHSDVLRDLCCAKSAHCDLLFSNRR